MFYLLMLAIYHITLINVESISVGEYFVNIAVLGIVGCIFAFIASFLVVVKRVENGFLWTLLDMFLTPKVTPSNSSAFIKATLPKLIIYEIFFVTLFLVGSNIL